MQIHPPHPHHRTHSHRQLQRQGLGPGQGYGLGYSQGTYGGSGGGGGGGGFMMSHTHDRGSSIYDGSSQRLTLTRPAGVTPFTTNMYSPKGQGLGGEWDQQQAESYGTS